MIPELTKPFDDPVEVSSGSASTVGDEADIEITGSSFHPPPYQQGGHGSPPTKKIRLDSGSVPVPKYTNPTANTSQRNGPTSTSSGPIDLTNDAESVRYNAPSQAPAIKLDKHKPVCIGSFDTQGLILYPSKIMHKGDNTAEMVQQRKVRVDGGGEEWLKIKIKGPKAKAMGIASGSAVPEAGQVGPVLSITNGKFLIKPHFSHRRLADLF